MTPQERQEVLGRLAASEVASLKAIEIDARKMQIEYDACLKVISVLSIPVARAAAVVQTLIEHLQGSDLTINFRADNFFEGKPGGSVRNTWQQGNSTPHYLKTRDMIEEKLFDYSGTSGRNAPLAVLTRLRLFGARNNSNGASNAFFKTAMRPKYGALNYTRQLHGAVSMYGGSCMILKEHIKHNCTFTARDSFNYENDSDAANRTANYHNMGRLIANMTDDTLKKLYNIATGSSLPVPRVPGMMKYLEAQIHASIEFNRDVSAICIASVDLGGPNGPKIRGAVQKFAQRNSIQVRYI